MELLIFYYLTKSQPLLEVYIKFLIPSLKKWRLSKQPKPHSYRNQNADLSSCCQNLAVIEMQEFWSLCMGARGAFEGPVAWVGLAGPFLLCESTSVLCALKPTWLPASPSPAWLEPQELEDRVQTFSWRLGFWRRWRPDKILEVFWRWLSLQEFFRMTGSAPVCSTVPQTLFCREVSHDHVVNVQAYRTASPSPHPEPSEGDGRQDGPGHAGESRHPTNLSGLSSSVPLSVCLSICLSASLSLPLSSHISSKVMPGGSACKDPCWRRHPLNMWFYNHLSLGSKRVKSCTGF